MKAGKHIRILYVIVVIVLLGGVIGLWLIDKKKTEQEEAVNRQAASDAEISYGKRQYAGKLIYDQLQTSLETVVDGFVCLGDDATIGSRQGSLPSALKKKINDTYLYQINQDLINIAGKHYNRDPEVSVINMGVSGEGLYEILARCGANQLVTGEEFEIPEDTVRAEFTMTDEYGHKLSFTGQDSENRFGATTIKGIRGELHLAEGEDPYSKDQDEDRPGCLMEFEREEEGPGQTVPAGTAVETESAMLYRMKCPILYFNEPVEKAGSSISAKVFVQSMQKILSIYGGKTDRFVMICNTVEGSSYDKALAGAFGDRYLRSAGSQDQMKEKEYQDLAEKVFESLSAQGSFEELERITEETKRSIEEW